MDIPNTFPPGQYVIYALIDPTDQRVYYVGQTRNPQRRLEQHVAARHHQGPKGDWLRHLKRKDQQPLMRILETVTDEQAALEKEQAWIRHFLEQQMPLLNAQAQPASSTQALIPLRQKIVVLLGHPLTVVQLPNQEIAVSLRSLCKMLKVARNKQAKRIYNDEALSQHLLPVLIQTAGGSQICDVLTDWAIPIWASGFNTSRLPEKKQALALLVRHDAFAAIKRAFTRPENQASAPEFPAAESSVGIVDQIRQGFSLLSTGFTTLAAGQQNLSERVTTLEGGPARPIIAFAPQRLAHIYLLARRIRARQGLPVSEILAGLADHFRVEDISDLPESHWPAILTWFQSLLEE